MTLSVSLTHLSGACEAKIGGRQAEQCAAGASEAGWGQPNKLRPTSARWKIPTLRTVSAVDTKNAVSLTPKRSCGRRHKKCRGRIVESTSLALRTDTSFGSDRSKP
jgi:hypothetical protein